MLARVEHLCRCIYHSLSNTCSTIGYSCWHHCMESQRTQRKTLGAGQDPTANSNHMRRWVQELNPGHRGGRWVLIHCANHVPQWVIIIRNSYWQYLLFILKVLGLDSNNNTNLTQLLFAAIRIFQFKGHFCWSEKWRRKVCFSRSFN